MIVTDFWSSRGESTTSKVGFCAGNMQQRLAIEEGSKWLHWWSDKTL